MEDLILGLQLTLGGLLAVFCIRFLRRMFVAIFSDDPLEPILLDLESWNPLLRDSALSKLLEDPGYDPMEGGYKAPRDMPGFFSKTAPRLIGVFLSSFDASFRARAARALGELKLSQGIDPLIAALHNDRNPVVRKGVAEGLALLRGKKSIDALIKALANDPDPDLRQTVATLLGDLNNADAMGPLTQAVSKDPSPGVRTAARTACARLSQPVSGRST